MAWLIPIDPVVVIVPPVRGEVAVMDVTLPFPVPNGPTVKLLILAKTPVVVAQRSPFTGVVGAAPAPRFSPAVVVVEATVFSFPVIVPPDRDSFPLKVVQSPELRYPFVVPLAWLIPIDPVVVIVPPVSGEVAVMDVTLPFPVPNGPKVELLILA